MQEYANNNKNLCGNTYPTSCHGSHLLGSSGILVGPIMMYEICTQLAFLVDAYAPTYNDSPSL